LNDVVELEEAVPVGFATDWRLLAWLFALEVIRQSCRFTLPAEDRVAAVDAALKAAAMRFDATLNAQKALEDSRYASTVRDIAAAREEAKHKTEAAKKEFKVALLSLKAVATEQVHKVNTRVNQLHFP